MKQIRHNAIRQLILTQPISNQEELRRLLMKRGFEVTQATLSRDLHEMRLYKGPDGYRAPAVAVEEDDDRPAMDEVLRSFGLKVKQAMNQLVLLTTDGSAQPVAVAIDYEELDEVVGTIAGDNTVLVICPDTRNATLLRTRLEEMIG
jgi:transcriptional regulator of arginine metabolism